MRFGRITAAILVATLVGKTTMAEGKSLIQVATAEKTYAGRLLAMGSSTCWMVARDGRMNRLNVGSLKSFKQISKRFEPYSTSELRNQLREEFGSEFEVVQHGLYMVVAKPGRGKEFARVLNEVFGVFQREFSTRGFAIAQPEFPLVAIIFPSRSEYIRYAAKEGFIGAGATLGYYKRESNRVAAFETVPLQRSKAVSVLESSDRPLLRQDDDQHYAAIGSDLRDTLIHEAIHQIAFNTNIHSRIGNDPRWVIEGLATLFETEGIRHRATRYEFATRINRERYLRFGNYAKTRRKKNSLRDFVSSEGQFGRNVLDAYAEAWALSFFLFDTRGPAYAKFMNSIATRDVLKVYTASARLKHFEAAFGDIDKLEVHFLRYMKKIKL